jgi:hypothetical protein
LLHEKANKKAEMITTGMGKPNQRSMVRPPSPNALDAVAAAMTRPVSRKCEAAVMNHPSCS